MPSIYGDYSKRSRLRIDYSYEQNIEKNQTTFTLVLYAEKPSEMGTHNYGYHDSRYTITGKEGSQLINDTGDWVWGNTTEYKVAESTYTYTHNPDGTGSCVLSASWNTGMTSSSVVGNSMSVSGLVNLPTIPRASSISATDANIGSTSTVMINRASDNFTHTIDYSFEGLSGNIATKTKETVIPFDIPTTFFEKIPETQSGTVTLTCYTFSGDTHIGTKTTTMTVSVPTSGENSSMPVIDSATAVDINERTLALTEDNSRLVTYFSNVKVNATGRCLNYGTFNILKSNNVLMSNETTESDGITTVKGEVEHESNSSNSFNIFLGDKRGLWIQKVLNEENGDFKIVPYIPLTMSVEAKRVSPISNSAILKFSGNFYNGYYDEAKSNFNDLTIKWRYKLRDSDSWILEGADDTENGWHNLILGTDYKYNENANTYSSIDDITIEDLFDYQQNYTIEILYEDRLSSYKTQQPILAGIPNHDYGVDVNGNNYFNVNGNIYANGKSILDLIYPVNSIYLSMSGIEPSTLFGGTWKRISEGRMLLGVGGSGEGGDNDIEGNTTNWCGELNNDYYSFGVGERGGQYFNTLTEAQMPSHYHRGLRYSGNDKKIQMNSGGSQYNLSWGGSGSDGDDEIYTESKGSGEAHNNMPPYLAVYIWQRTA